MPTYEYLCQTCRHRFETWQKMTDEPLTTCPECGGSIRRVLHAAGIVFKGHGFYKTDYSNGKSSGTNGSSESHEHSGTNGANGENGKSESSKSESSTTTTESKAASSSTDSKPSSESKTTTSAGTK